MKMRSSFDQKIIIDELRDLMEKAACFMIWQTSTQGRQKYKAKLSQVNHDKSELTIEEGNLEDMNPTEAFFAHTSDHGDVIFKRDYFQLNENTISFKTPTEMKFVERREIPRFTYKYQDFKGVRFELSETSEKFHFTLMDLSINGLCFAAPRADIEKIQEGQKVEISFISDQVLPEGHHGKIVYIESFYQKEEPQNKLDPKELMKAGIQFLPSLNRVIFKSIQSVIDKKQEKVMGIKTKGFNGLSEEDQKRVLSHIASNDQAQAAQITDQIEELDRLRYLTSQMKQLFWSQVDLNFLAIALRLSSKELIFDLLIELTENRRSEFLEKLDHPKLPAEVLKAQEIICSFIREKEKSNELVLNAEGFDTYV